MAKLLKMNVADEPTLRQLFEAGWEAQRKTESGELSSNTQDYKVRISYVHELHKCQNPTTYNNQVFTHSEERWWYKKLVVNSCNVHLEER